MVLLLVGRRLELDNLLLALNVSLVAVVLGDRTVKACILLANLLLNFLLNRVEF